MFLVVALLILAPKVSPFTEVGFRGDTVMVRYEGKRYELLAIDGIAPAKLIAASKRAFGRKWDKRITEDLCELFEAMGHEYGATVSLKLRPAGGGAVVEIAKARMTRENREAARQARRRRPRPPATLSAVQVHADVVYLQRVLRERYAYYRIRGTDGDALAAKLQRIRGPMTAGKFAGGIQFVLNGFGDGHAGLRRPGARANAPFLFGRHGDRVYAFRSDRADFAVPGFPYVRSIDGRPISFWLGIADRFVPRGSPQFRARNGVRALRGLSDLGVRRDIVAFEFEDVAGEKTRTVKLPLAPRRAAYGDWPRRATGVLPGDIGYLRIADMTRDTSAAEAALERFRSMRGLILDVRGNGGGTRDHLLKLLPHFLKEPRVVNVARYRLGPGEEENAEGHLANRFLYPITWSGWSAADREHLAAFAKTFEPEWEPGKGFSAWHYMLVRPGEKHFDKPVVVLLDAGCFSATDIFLGGFKGVAGVILLGEPSGGGSARSRGYRLPESGLSLRLASMASFQPDGKLYDGNGIQPGVVVPAQPSDALGRTDTQLDAALARLRK